MKRPLALVGFSYLLALLAAVLLGANSLLMACFCLGGSLILVFARKGKYRISALVLLTCALALGDLFLHTTALVEKAQSYAGNGVFVQGYVWTMPEYEDGRYQYQLQVPENSLGGEHPSFRIRLTSKEKLAVRTGDFLSGKAALFAPSVSRELGGQVSWLADGIYLYGYFQEEDAVLYVPRKTASLHDWVWDFREQWKTQIHQWLGKDGGLVQALLLGDKNNLSQTLTENFQGIGVSHLLAVSGFHMTLVVQFVSLLLGKLLPFRRVRAFFTAGLILFFMAVTGFTPSVCRSGCMCLLFLWGSAWGRHSDGINSLGLAVWLMLLVNPWAAVDIGFLLSVSACLGMFLLSKPMTQSISRKIIPVSIRLRLPGRILHGVVRGVSVSVSTLVFTLPLSLLIFGTVPVIAPLANLLLLYPVSLLIYLALFGLLLLLLPFGGLLSAPFLWAVRLLCDFAEGVAELLSRVPYGSVPFAGREAMLWLACSFLLCGVTVWIMKAPKLFRATGLLCTILLLLTAFSSQLARRNVVSLYIAQAGTGISSLFVYNGNAALVGCRGYSEVPAARLLQESGTPSLAAGILLSGEYEEAGNAGSLLEKYPAELLMIPRKEIQNGELLNALPQIGQLYCFEEMCTGTWLECLQVEAFGGFTRISCRGTSVLFWPSGAKAADLPQSWKHSDLVVLETPQKGMEDLSCAAGILCTDSWVTAEDALQWQTCPYPLADTASGTIRIDFTAERTIQFRRK